MLASFISNSGFSSSSWKRTGAQIRAEQEVLVLERELIGLALGLRRGRHMLGGSSIDFRIGENALGGLWVGHTGRGLARLCRA